MKEEIPDRSAGLGKNGNQAVVVTMSNINLVNDPRRPSRLILPTLNQKGSEHKKFSPWAVTVPVRVSDIDPRTHETTYYVRAGQGHQAAHMAAMLWTEWEKKAKRLGTPIQYPDVEGHCTATAIDDKDFAEAWKEAVRAPIKFWAGGKDNPMAFAFYPEPPEWWKASLVV